MPVVIRASHRSSPTLKTAMEISGNLGILCQQVQWRERDGGAVERELANGMQL